MKTSKIMRIYATSPLYITQSCNRSDFSYVLLLFSLIAIWPVAIQSDKILVTMAVEVSPFPPFFLPLSFLFFFFFSPPDIFRSWDLSTYSRLVPTYDPLPQPRILLKGSLSSSLFNFLVMLGVEQRLTPGTPALEPHPSAFAFTLFFRVWSVLLPGLDLHCDLPLSPS
jgi:hypothetical protein